MSSTCKPRMRCSSDARRELKAVLLGAETAHKADILTYSRGHLGPRSLFRSQALPRPSEPLWETSKSPEEKVPDQTRLRRRAAATLANVEKMKEALCEFTLTTALLEPGGSAEPSRGTTRTPPHTDACSREERKGARRSQRVLETFELFLVRPRAQGQRAQPAVGPEDQDRFWWTQSHLAGLTKRDQLRMMQQFDRLVLGRQDLRDRSCMTGSKAAKAHESKLAKELRKLPGPALSSQRRLRAFCDVFQDVCDGSPVFGDVLREIKTDYDLYLHSLLDAQAALQDMSVLASLSGLEDGAVVGKEELEEAGQEVWRLGEEARSALEENDRVRNLFQNSRDRALGFPEVKGLCRETLPGLGGPGEGAAPVSSIDRVQPKRRQVWSVWEEVQQLEKEIKEKMVSTVTTSATERCIRDSKAEIMRLLASNERFRINNKDLESSVSAVLKRVGASEDEKAEVWDRIWSALRHEEE